MHIFHRTSDGAKVPIAGMTDEHLANTIKLRLRELEQTTASLNVIDRKVSALTEALYGITPQKISDSAKQRLPLLLEKLYPYLAESMLRGVYYTKELQLILGRTGRDEAVPQLPAEHPAKLLPGRRIALHEEYPAIDQDD